MIQDTNYVPTQKLLLKINSQKLTAKTCDVIFTNRAYHLKRRNQQAARNLYNRVILAAGNSSAPTNQETRNGSRGRE